VKRWQLLGLVHGVNLLAHVMFATALGATLPHGGVFWVAALLFALSTYRVHRSWPDHPRPRWLIRWVDEPVFVHWGACVISFPLLIVAHLLSLTGYLAVVGLYGFGFLVSAWAVWGSRRFVRVSHVGIEHARLPDAFEGYRIAHLTDLHVGSFDDLDRAREWVRKANREGVDLALVTGDLVTSGTWFYDDVASALGELAARDGIFVSLGNHDQWDSDALVEKLTKHGCRALRNDVAVIDRGDASLLIAGIDDRFAGRADLGATLARRPFAGYTVLMSHYPDYLGEAHAFGIELVLSGHTHGGQIGVPWLAARLNVATLTGQRGRGLFWQGDTALFVSAGLGTTGPPMRLGIAPEIAVLELHAKGAHAL
jgi:predicted MPP superfamily phosphohydrolase